MTRRGAAGWVTFAALAAAGIAALVLAPITRDPGFHVYADQRTWLGIPHAGDVLSNLVFLVVAAHYLRRASTGVPGARGAIAGVAAIGLGSSIYHWAPSDVTLILDWSAIVATLMIVLAVVVRDRLGARVGHVVLTFAPLYAIATVGWWIWTGGTLSGGNMTPYVAIQAVGVLLPAILAVVAPGKIPAAHLFAALILFVLARTLAAHDRQLLELIGISGHSLKHVAAALAAAFALHALHPRAGS